MFIKLLIKEWRERAALAVFGMVMTAAFIAAAVAFAGKPELAEGLAYVLLLLFLPVFGLLLGSSGFDAEFRDGAWAYLFSRPVGKVVLWFSKYCALASILAASWLIFAAGWAAFPGLRGLVGGLRVLFGFGTQFGFPWLSVFGSFFLMTLAFSLSLLSERPFNAFLSSLILGLAVSAAAYAVLNAAAPGFAAMLSPTRALGALELIWLLTAAAVSAASILTFVKADFSQPRKRLAKFVPAAAVFILAGFAVTAAWTVWGPVHGERFINWTGSFGDSQYFSTESGVLRYSGERDELSWLVKSRWPTFPFVFSGGRWQAYLSYRIKSRDIAEEELWLMNSDGSERKLVLRLGPSSKAGPNSPEGIDMWSVFPDPEGRRVVFIADERGAKARDRRSSFWVINSDGTGLERLPLDQAIGLGPFKDSWAQVTAWSPDGKKLLIYHRVTGTKPYVSRLWLYDLEKRTAVPAVNSDSVGYCVPSPDGKHAAVPNRDAPEGRLRLGLLDLRTMVLTDLDVGGTTGFMRLNWSRKGDKFMFTAQRKGPDGSGDYVWQVYDLNAAKVVAERDAGRDERAVLMGMAGWMTDDRRIARLDVTERAVKIMSPDLRDVKSVPLPAVIVRPAGLFAAGDKVLVEDSTNGTLWRYDTVKDSWKKIY